PLWKSGTPDPWQTAVENAEGDTGGGVATDYSSLQDYRTNVTVGLQDTAYLSEAELQNYNTQYQESLLHYTEEVLDQAWTGVDPAATRANDFPPTAATVNVKQAIYNALSSYCRATGATDTVMLPALRRLLEGGNRNAADTDWDDAGTLWANGLCGVGSIGTHSIPDANGLVTLTSATGGI
ncbi:MAG: hypothetical protein PHQ75_13065, partial [Thermoguttaceae bacterium]|nr:hypothetical protein [Thermoguttaceae bacterium]